MSSFSSFEALWRSAEIFREMGKRTHHGERREAAERAERTELHGVAQIFEHDDVCGAIFARHDLGAGDRVEPISTTTGRNIITQRVKEALGEAAAGTITPHSFRHFFVTEVLQGSGGNIKLAQKLARHKNIQVTQRYAHLSNEELDKGYHDIFEG